MANIKFEDITAEIQPNDFISFHEYTLDRRNKKQLTLSIERQEVGAVVLPDVSLNRDELEQFYGRELEEIEYKVLSTSCMPRLVLQITDPEHPEKGMVYHVISLNKDYMKMGLQVLEKTENPVVFVNPNQMLNSERGGIKGFSDYQVGAGLYRNIPKNS